MESFCTLIDHFWHKCFTTSPTKKDSTDYLYGCSKIEEIALKTLNNALPVNLSNACIKH